MESYTDLDLHLQFVCFLLNTITDVNCIQYVFRQCKIQQSRRTNKTHTDTKQYQN